MRHGSTPLDSRCLGLACIALLLATCAATGHAAPLPPRNPAPGVVGKYVGPGGCAASSCHGAVQPRMVTRILQNEYSVWVVQDKHARAFDVLSNKVSSRMARILKIGKPNTEAKCLRCHATYTTPAQREQNFEIDDGVSCEACHGPASGWLGPHTVKDWPHEKSIPLGMIDTRNMAHRTEQCLTCHLGTAEKFVDHEMIAAGHPDLTFELSSFSAVMPRHWKVDKQKDPWYDLQSWSIGQAVQLKEEMNRLSRRAKGPVWPEYSELDCFTCHHSLTKPDDSWRQELGYGTRRAGNPPWNHSRYAVFRELVHQLNADDAQQLEKGVEHVAALVGELQPNRDELATAAAATAVVADRLAKQLGSTSYNREMAIRLMRGISGRADWIAWCGERSAEQAAMAMDSLLLASGGAGNQQAIRSVVDTMFQQLQNPSAYNAPAFAAQLKKINALVGGGGNSGN
jgi:hypothetical protein